MSGEIDMEKIKRWRDDYARNAGKATSEDYENRGSQMAYQALALRSEGHLDAAADANEVEADAWLEAGREDLAEAALWSAAHSRRQGTRARYAFRWRARSWFRRQPGLANEER